MDPNSWPLDPIATAALVVRTIDEIDASSEEQRDLLLSDLLCAAWGSIWAMSIASGTDSGARRRQLMEGRSAERLANEIRQQELAHVRAMRRPARPDVPGARREAGKPPENQ
jgi:hypothetical protein